MQRAVTTMLDSYLEEITCTPDNLTGIKNNIRHINDNIRNMQDDIKGIKQDIRNQTVDVDLIARTATLVSFHFDYTR